nr:uncharacterized protein K02A2.6-like [Aegilops tauschii subsp. strangulata]
MTGYSNTVRNLEKHFEGLELHHVPRLKNQAADDLAKMGSTRKTSHKRASALKTIPLTWSFAVWGLDMVGPLQTGASGFTHLLVVVDKFTKWIEAKLIKKLDPATTIQFIKEIVFRFGVPHNIITDNGSNFDSDEFREFCYTQGTRVDYASVAYPQSNGQAERANGLIRQGLKPRLMRD